MKNEVEVAYCGVVCSDCGAYKRKRCGGCASGTQKFKSCPVRKCNIEKGQSSCAECKAFVRYRDCKKLWNIFAKVFYYIFRSNRIGNLESIRACGLEEFCKKHQNRSKK